MLERGSGRDTAQWGCDGCCQTKGASYVWMHVGGRNDGGIMPAPSVAGATKGAALTSRDSYVSSETKDGTSPGPVSV